MSASIPLASLEQSSVPCEDAVQIVHLVGQHVQIPDVGKSSCCFLIKKTTTYHLVTSIAKFNTSFIH